MRFVSFNTSTQSAPRPGILLQTCSAAKTDHEQPACTSSLSPVLDLGLYFGTNYASMLDFIQQVNDTQLAELAQMAENDTGTLELAVRRSSLIPHEEYTIQAPIIRPLHDIICVGVNYQDHLDESKSIDTAIQKPQDTVFFGKRACCISGTGSEITFRPDLDPMLDYEVELAVIIGKEARDITPEQALEYVFGYSIFNDFSSRALQKKHLQWYKGKSLDGLSALGPWIVHANCLGDPCNLEVTCRVNNEVRQHSTTAKMIRNIPALIAELSQGMTLEAGDIIATGTPAGVGMGFTPPRMLKAGDVVECEIEKIGILRNTIK